MALGYVLAGAGLSLISVAAGLVIGGRCEFRRLARHMTDEAQDWLDRRASTA